MNVMMFHLMVDGNKSHWVTLPNSEYDPATGRK